MFHLRGLTLDGVMGKSVVAAAQDSIGLGLAAETFAGSFFRNGLKRRRVFEASREAE